MPIVRRSLQRPRPGEPYLTEDLDVIPTIKQGLQRASQGDRNRLRDLADEIGPTWGKEDDDGRVRLALFGCEVLRLVRQYLDDPQISEDFLNQEIQSLRTLRWALKGGQLWRRQKVFLEALRENAYNDWLHEIRVQSMVVHFALKEIGNA